MYNSYFNTNTINLSVKETPIGKPAHLNGRELTFGWQSVEITPDALVTHIESGKPFAVAHFTAGHRKGAHFLRSSIIALDIDADEHGQPLNTEKYEQLLALEIIQAHAFAVIPTFSSRRDAHKCRVLFQLDDTITDPAEYTALVVLLHERVPLADAAAKDAGRAFLGGRPGIRADFTNFENILPVAPLREELQRRLEATQREAVQVTPKSSGSGLSELPPTFIDAVVAALGAEGSSEWSQHVACPVVKHENDHKNPASQWHFDKHFLYCHKCGRPYNAITVGKALNIDLKDYLPKRPKKKRGRKKSLRQKVRPYALNSLSGETVNLRYISELADENLHGMTLIASPTGTGKTELAKQLIQRTVDNNPLARILVIVHRRNLARQTAERYDLPCYLDLERLDNQPRLVICVNSLYKLGTRLEDYDLVIIDEQTQMHKHLFGDTFRGNEGLVAIEYMQQIIRTAQRVLSLDAGMNDIAAEWARSLRNDVRCLTNTYRQPKGTCTLYEKKDRVIQKALDTATSSQHIVIATGLNMSETLYNIFTNRFGEERVRVVNSRNGDLPDTQAFISNINEQLPKVLIYTPTLDCGIDITAEVDAVFGIFQGNALDGDAINQMLGRCRNAKERHLYVQPNVDGRMDEDAYRLHGILESIAILTGNDAHFDQHNRRCLTPQQSAFAQLEAQYTAERHRSLNNLLAHSVAILHDTGWQVAYNLGFARREVSEMVLATSEGLKALRQRKTVYAEPVSEDDMQAHRRAGTLTDEHQWGYARWKLEELIGQDLTDENYPLVESDRDKAKLRRFRDLLNARLLRRDEDRLQADDGRRSGHSLAKRDHHNIRAELMLSLLERVFGITDIRQLPTVECFSNADICENLKAWHAENIELVEFYFPATAFKQKSAIAQLRHLLKLIGVEVLKRQIWQGDKRHYVYWIAKHHFERWLALGHSSLQKHLREMAKKPDSVLNFVVGYIYDPTKTKIPPDLAAALNTRKGKKFIIWLKKLLEIPDLVGV